MTPRQRVNKQKFAISSRIWFYFLAFIVVVLLIIWIMQNFFIDRSYTTIMVKEVQEIGRDITRAYHNGEDITLLIREKSMGTTLNIKLVDNSVSVIYPEDWLRAYYEEEFRANPYKDLAKNFPRRPGDHEIYGLKDAKRTQVFYYVSNLGRTQAGESIYLLIESPLRSTESTISIMRAQFPYIGVMTIIIGSVVAFFSARRISKPIEDLSTAARSLPLANYDTSFPQTGISELDELADTLNYATQELAKMDENRISLLVNISHDLKTPLTVIKSYADMIKDITGEDKKLRDQNLDVIIEEADRLTEMVNSILEITKLELDMEELTYSKFSLVEMTEDIIHTMEVFEQTSSIELKLQVDSRAYIEADQTKIRQVAYNLISNAISFVGEDKTVTINIKEDDQQITYQVIDTGPGIPKDKQDQVWQRYYTSSNNHTRSNVGTGLGLHIAKVVLEEHDFEYGLDSKLGEGSTFYFIIEKDTPID